MPWRSNKCHSKRKEWELLLPAIEIKESIMEKQGFDEAPEVKWRNGWKGIQGFVQ